jgi:hypothetical protein
MVQDTMVNISQQTGRHNLKDLPLKTTKKKLIEFKPEQQFGR